MDLSNNISVPYHGSPIVKNRLRWEIWSNGVLHSYNSWTPLSVLKFSDERLKAPSGSVLYIAMLSLDGYEEQKMLKVHLDDVEKMEYHHLIVGQSQNTCVGIRLHTSQGIFNCCASGEVFKEEQ